MDILAGDSEVVLLVAFAGRRRTPFPPEAPGQGEKQRQLQQGRQTHFPRASKAISSSSALCASGAPRLMEQGWEEGGLEGVVTSAPKRRLERGKKRLLSAPFPWATLHPNKLARRLTARSVCSLTLHTSPSCPLCFPNCPLVFLPLFLSKASLRCPLLSLSLNPAGPLFPWVTSPKHCLLGSTAHTLLFRESSSGTDSLGRTRIPHTFSS